MTAETVLSPTGATTPGADRERHPGPSLSPSRAADFKTCPLLFRFRTIDRLPEQPTRDQLRGTLVHAVLERLFDLPAEDRTPRAAAALVAPQWERLVEQEPEVARLFEAPVDVAAPVAVEDHPIAAQPSPAPPAAALPEAQALPGMPEGRPADELARLEAFLASAGELLDGYFAVEDPRRLQPAEREALVSTLVDDDLLIRGYIDRLDVSPAGDLRVVDYKTGGAPREAFEGRALFQLKFYALVLWRTRGVVPRVLRLLYLKDAEICDYSPDAEELERFERTLVALSQAIERAKQDRDFRPKPSRLCGWCSHQQFCPEFGGTPPPYPEPAAPAEQPAPALSTPACDMPAAAAEQPAPAPGTPASDTPAAPAAPSSVGDPIRSDAGPVLRRPS
ncbi:PD-(D/E)XK nuclease family protein [Couchioplanes caeruleus]|uniref:RecB family exonuclease n=1 Tax=Couchioplanes caeruleus TaxID=56438 RepID=UPI0020BF3A6A|nr:PD-(D/E)XK nuclease family protein [Couchioplanes caeruleus]UQU68116.1 PD-(D/E)XK nuclease family protein [Couchioplanes caeruleus]